MKMYSKILAVGTILMLASVLSSSAQFYDDLYYNPKKANKVTKVKVKKSGNNQQIYIQPQQDDVTIYYEDIDYNNIVNGRDVDEYNRRYTTNADYGEEWTREDSIAMAREDLATYGGSDDYKYSRRIQAFYNPTIVIENDPSLDVAALGFVLGATSAAAWYPYSSWYWNNWRPSWSWNIGWNSWGWGPSWSFNWNWGPSWNWGPGWGWGHAWRPGWGHHGWCPSWGWAPAPRPPYNGGPGWRPGYNQSGRRPFGYASAPSHSTNRTPLGNRRPSATRTPLGNSRPGYATSSRRPGQSAVSSTGISNSSHNQGSSVSGKTNRRRVGSASQNINSNTVRRQSSSTSRRENLNRNESSQNTTRRESYDNHNESSRSSSSYDNSSSRRSNSNSFSNSSRGGYSGGGFGGGSRSGGSSGGGRRR